MHAVVMRALMGNVTFSPTVLGLLEEGKASLTTLLYSPVHQMLEDWLHEVCWVLV